MAALLLSTPLQALHAWPARAALTPDTARASVNSGDDQVNFLQLSKTHDTMSPTSDQLDFCGYLCIIMPAEKAEFATGPVLQRKKKKSASIVLFMFSTGCYGILF